MIIKKYVTEPVTFTASNFNFFNKQSRISKLSSNYTDELIKQMAKDSSKKEATGCFIDVFARKHDVTFLINDGKNEINSWLINSLLPSNNYCIFFHGGTSTIGNYQKLYQHLSNNNINVLAVEFPGYGLNKDLDTGYELISQTAESAYKYLTQTCNIPEKDISILGYCLGGQIASELANKTNPKALMLVSPVTKLNEVNPDYIESKNVAEKFSSKFERFIVKNIFFKKYMQNQLKLNINSKCPVYIISSHGDKVVSKKNLDKIFHKVNKDDNITYISGIENGHELSDNKIKLVADLLGDNMYDSRSYYDVII